MNKLTRIKIIFVLLISVAYSGFSQTFNMSTAAITTCSGTYQDPQGASNYNNNLNVTQTICSDNGQPIYLQFTAFNTQAGFDILSIYNGPTTASPLLGAYSGTTSPGTIQGTGTCLTLVFTSNIFTVASGWVATIGCGTPPVPPIPPGTACNSPNSFCGTPITYPAGTGGTVTAPVGPDYGCLGSQPNPAWYNMQVQTTGPMDFTLSAGSDIDFIIWGPFTSPSGACLAGLTTANIIDCGYTTSSNETPSIPNAIAGQYYILLITNFSGAAQNINFTQSGGAGVANCNILCNITNMTGTAGACQVATNTFDVNGTITTTAPPSSGTLTISSSCSGTPLVFNPPFSTSTNYTLTGIPTTTGSCILSAVYSADASCTRTVTVTSPPACGACTVTASNTGAYCPGATISLSTTAVTGATYTWTGPNSFSATGQTVTIPNATVAMSGMYTVTAVAGPATCVATTSVTVNPQPTLTVNTPTVCLGATATLNISGATTYNWLTAGTNPTTGASVTSAPLITSTYFVEGIDANGCKDTIQATITITANPVVNAGTDITICQGSSTNLLATGTSIYNWNADPTLSATTIFNPTATPAVSTEYIVTGSEPSGCSATDTVWVFVTPIPVLPFCPVPPAICEGQSVTLTATPSGSGEIYTWMPGNLTGSSITVSPTVSTAYSFSYISNGCQSPTETIPVTVNPIPVVTVNSSTICIGDNTTLNANGATTYNWSPANGLSAVTGASVTANPTVTTVYLISGTTLGCTGTTTATVTVNNLPLVDAGIQDTVCLGSFASLNASGAINYVWTADPTLSGTATASPTATPITTTTYFVTGTDGNGCSNTDNVILVVPPTFSVSATAGPANCFASCDGFINSTVTPAVSAFGPYTYVWTNGSTSSNISSLCAGTYFVTASDISGCAQTTSAIVTEPSAPLSITQTNNLPVTCNGGSDGSFAVAASGGTAPYTFSVNGGAFTAITSSSGLAAGTYSVVAKDVNACTTSPLLITINEPQIVSVNPPSVSSVTICIGQSTTLSALATGGNGGYSYTWNDGINPAVISLLPVTVTPLTSPVHYTVTATDVTGCTSNNQQVITVFLHSPLTMNPIVPAPGKICETKNIVVNVSGQGGDNSLIYSWTPTTGVTLLNTEGSSVRLSPSTSTVYTVTVNDGCTTPTDFATYSLTVNPIPTLSITPASISGCAPLPVQFTGSSSPAAATCNWNFGGNGSSTSCNTFSNFAIAGNYSVTYSVVDINGCENSKTASVSVFPVPEAMFVASPQPTTIIDPVITFTDITQANIASHTWIFNDSIGTNSILEVASYTYEKAGVYPVTLAVETNNGCVDTVTQNVYIDEDFVIYIPNSFTPDGDGLNEEFVAVGNGITELEMTIYDRWGGTVFMSGEIGKGWNGKDKSDKRVEKGIYIYKMIVTNFKGEKKLVSGHVTLVR